MTAPLLPRLSSRVARDIVGGLGRYVAVPFLLVAVLTSLLAAPALAAPATASFPEGAVSDGSGRIVFWGAVAVLVVAQVVLLVAEIRRPRAPSSDFPRLASRTMEIVWLLLPVALLAALLIFTWPTLFGS